MAAWQHGCGTSLATRNGDGRRGLEDGTSTVGGRISDRDSQANSTRKTQEYPASNLLGVASFPDEFRSGQRLEGVVSG